MAEKALLQAAWSDLPSTISLVLSQSLLVLTAPCDGQCTETVRGTYGELNDEEKEHLLLALALCIGSNNATSVKAMRICGLVRRCNTVRLPIVSNTSNSQIFKNFPYEKQSQSCRDTVLSSTLKLLNGKEATWHVCDSPPSTTTETL